MDSSKVTIEWSEDDAHGTRSASVSSGRTGRTSIGSDIGEALRQSGLGQLYRELAFAIATVEHPLRWDTEDEAIDAATRELIAAAKKVRKAWYLHDKEHANAQP